MASTNLIRKIVSGFLSENYEEVLETLNLEAAKLKSTGKKNTYSELQAIIRKIPASKKREVSAASAAPAYKEINLSSSPPTKLVREYRTQVSSDDVILNSHSKNQVASFFREWEYASELLKKNLRPTNKLLFYGPPGTGKTHLAHAVAHQLDLPLALVKLDELISSYLGNTGKNVREIFAMAEVRPMVLFIDEFDSIAKFRSDEKELGELKRIVTVLLQNIDDFPGGSVLIAATNHEELLDKAIWRRFPLKVKMDLPDKESVGLLIRNFLTDFETHADFTLLGEILTGLSGSELRDIIDSAKKNSVLSGLKSIGTGDILHTYLYHSKSSTLHNKLSKVRLYQICQLMKDTGYSLKDIATISGVPYSTLCDNLT